MEHPQPITATPVQLDADRDVVETIFLDHCWNKNLGFKELMLLAYRQGKSDGRIAALDETLQSLRASRTTPPKAHYEPDYDPDQEPTERELTRVPEPWDVRHQFSREHRALMREMGL